jgi:pyruvate,water dikinase
VGKYPVKSVLPAKMVDEIIATAKSEDKLITIQSSKEEEVWEKCLNEDFGETGKLIQEYIHKYGDRSVGELKLENETFTQNPLRFITILKSYDDSPSIAFEQEDVDLNTVAKDIPWHKRGIFKYVAKKAAEMVADRENLRFDRTFGFGTIRMFLWQMGLNWVEAGVLKNHKDIFYLKESEVNSLVHQRLSAKQIQELINHRKAEFKLYEEIEQLPERVHQWDSDLDLEVTIEVHDGQLKGIPCCSGEVTGKVRVLSDPSEVGSLKGDILVTTSTDPGWITIFKSASAILVERGSTLSHAAIVSREMGIPCIVAVKGITSILKDGDIVKMNGETGIIEQINE